MSHLQSRQGRSTLGTLCLLLGLILLIGILILPFTPFASKAKRQIDIWVEKSRTERVVVEEKIREVIKEVEKKVEVIKEVKVPGDPTPLPSKFIPRKDIDVATLYNGITIQTQLQTEEGKFATVERKDKDAFKVEFSVKLRVPEPNNSLEELTKVNPELPKMLPGLSAMMSSSKVSGFYHKLYQNKVQRVQTHLTRLNRILDRHNFFDCETILEMHHPVSQRKVLLIQSEMDVVADGSDGDRMPVMNAGIYESTHYQPFTSYEWAKRGNTINPLLPKWQVRLDQYNKEYSQKGLSSSRNQELRDNISKAKTIIQGLKTRSSLIAETDPFIVLSLLFRGYANTNAYTPAMGDYAAVIHENKIYPAICGDYGPTFKMGEASLLMAKTINEKSTPYNRPESDLKVTYLVFPGTAERPFGPPNLEHWQQKVEAYLKECGGVAEGYSIHQWYTPPPPPPITPATTPAEGSTTPSMPGTPATSPSTPGLPTSTPSGTTPAMPAPSTAPTAPSPPAGA